MTQADWLGSVAGFCTTVAFLPQVLKVWRTRSARDVSMGMYSVFTLGVICWLAYGWLLMIWPIIVANIVTLVLVALVIAMKLRWG